MTPALVTCVSLSKYLVICSITTDSNRAQRQYKVTNEMLVTSAKLQYFYYISFQGLGSNRANDNTLSFYPLGVWPIVNPWGRPYAALSWKGPLGPNEKGPLGPSGNELQCSRENELQGPSESEPQGPSELQCPNGNEPRSLNVSGPGVPRGARVWEGAGDTTGARAGWTRGLLPLHARWLADDLPLRDCLVAGRRGCPVTKRIDDNGHTLQQSEFADLQYKQSAGSPTHNCPTCVCYDLIGRDQES